MRADTARRRLLLLLHEHTGVRYFQVDWGDLHIGRHLRSYSFNGGVAGLDLGSAGAWHGSSATCLTRVRHHLKQMGQGLGTVFNPQVLAPPVPI